MKIKKLRYWKKQKSIDRDYKFMRLIGWIIAGVSAATATTLGAVSLTGGGGSHIAVASTTSNGVTTSSHSSETDSRTQSTSDSHGTRTNTQVAPRSKVDPKTLYEALEKYRKCRKYSINCKSLLPIPKGSGLYEFLS